MPAGYSGTPLAKKLGLKPGDLVCLLDAPADFRKLLDAAARRRALRDEVRQGRATSCTCSPRRRRSSRRTLAACRKSLAPDAAIWVSWPKKAAKVPTDITEDMIRAVALPLGLVDIKVCAVDETWSGLKLVLRKELRAEVDRSSTVGIDCHRSCTRSQSVPYRSLNTATVP